MKCINELFTKFAKKASDLLGSSWAFLLALLIVVIWAIAGPFFDFSKTWQLFINTITTITTFLIVFLIQNTQNRDSKATHIKLDDLIKSLVNTRDKYISAEDLSDESLEKEKSKLLEQKKGKKKKKKRK